MGKYIWGLDPANSNDFFGLVCHNIESGVPRLTWLEKWQRVGYPEMLARLKDDLFKRFNPYYIVTDYTNEKTFSDLLEKLYGKSKLEKLNFGATTTSGVTVKRMLKQDGYAMLTQGHYSFPNPNGVTDPIQSANVMELMQQLRDEQIITTKAGNQTFDHPPGKHNDLAIAWELSIHGCQRFMMRSGPIQVANRKWGGEVDPLGTGIRGDYSYVTQKDIYYPERF